LPANFAGFFLIYFFVVEILQSQQSTQLSLRGRNGTAAKGAHRCASLIVAELPDVASKNLQNGINFY